MKSLAQMKLVRLLKKLDAENREPTEEELKLIDQYIEEMDEVVSALEKQFGEEE